MQSELATATQLARFARQLDVIAEAAALERGRLLQWAFAYAGLSAAWFLADGDRAGARTQRAIARIAARMLAGAADSSTA